MKITKRCPFCGEISSLNLTKEEYQRYQRYLRREDVIQNLLPTLNIFEREFLITGYCVRNKCQDLIFGRTSIVRNERW